MTGSTPRSQWPILTSVLLFATALGVNAVAFPLYAWEVGYGPAVVGYLGGITAAHQVVARLCLPWLLRRVADRWLILTASVLITGSGATLLLSTALAAFVASAVLLGVARALFWTVSQVHVLHGDLKVGQRTLSYLQFLSALGELIGPLVGGILLAWSADAALWLWVGCGAASILPLALLPRRAPLAPVDDRQRAPVWRQRGVLLGCAAVATTGGWRALLSSLVPAVLAELGRPAGQIGVLVTVANVPSVLGALLAGRIPARRIGPSAAAAMVLAGVGIGGVGVFAGSTPLLVVTLAASGLAGGMLQTFGPVLAAGAVSAAQRGDMMVLVGLVRSVALLVLPPGVGALVGVLTAPFALVAGGVVLAAPIITYWWRAGDGGPRNLPRPEG